MATDIPKIQFENDETPSIELLDFKDMFNKLKGAKSHNPYVAHKIEFHLILIVTRYNYFHFVDFKSYKLEEGSAIFIAKNQVHHFTEGLKDAEGIAIVVNSLFMAKYHFLSHNIKLNRLFNYHIGSPAITADELRDDSFLDIANMLFKEYALPDNYVKSEMMSTLFHALLLKAERAKEACAIKTIKPHWLEIFSNFKDILEREYVNTRNSRIYAQKLFISYKFLNDIVKQLTDKTAKSFIDDFVTIEIKRYLASTSLSIKEISFETGFEEPANMIKFFKRITKTTPLKFRQSL